MTAHKHAPFTARWAGIADTHAVSMGPVTTMHKGAAAGVLLGLAALSLSIKKQRPMPKPPAPEPDPKPPTPRKQVT